MYICMNVELHLRRLAGIIHTVKLFELIFAFFSVSANYNRIEQIDITNKR